MYDNDPKYNKDNGSSPTPGWNFERVLYPSLACMTLEVCTKVFVGVRLYIVFGIIRSVCVESEDVNWVRVTLSLIF